jgi:hypothetical protein
MARTYPAGQLAAAAMCSPAANYLQSESEPLDGVGDRSYLTALDLRRKGRESLMLSWNRMGTDVPTGERR